MTQLDWRFTAEPVSLTLFWLSLFLWDNLFEPQTVSFYSHDSNSTSVTRVLQSTYPVRSSSALTTIRSPSPYATPTMQS